MNILILGAGQVGRALAKSLAIDPQNHITIIDQDSKRLSIVQKYLDIRTIQGHASYPSILEDANIVSMDMVIAVTVSDEINILIYQMAHILYKVKKKFARIRAFDYLDNKLFNSNIITLDSVFSPEKLVTEHIKKIIQQKGTSEVLEFENGSIQLVTVKVYGHTIMDNTTIAKLHDELSYLKFRIVSVYRKKQIISPDGDTIIKENDEVSFICEKNLC